MSQYTEARLISLQVPQLIEDFLGKLQSAQHAATTSSPAAVISALREFCDSNQTALYYEAVAAHFENFVVQLPTSGFPHGFCAFFSVPQRDGTSVDLFPGGAQVLVTPHNVNHFIALYNQYKESKPYRYTDRVELLPLEAQCHLASDFSAILNLLDKELSKWKLDEQIWRSLNVTYSVPRNGVVVDVRPNGRATLVPHSDIHNYVQLSQKALGTAPSTRQQNAADFEKYVKAIYYAGKISGLRPLDENSFKLLDVRWCVPIMGKIVDLKENGADILVPLAEKDNFCRLAAAKLGINLEASDSAASAAAAAELGELDVPTNPELDGLMSPRRYAFNLFAPSRKDALANSLTTTLTNEEIEFHFKTVLRQLATGQWSDADVRSLNIFYEIPLNGHLVPLVDNGFKIPVTIDNKDDFVVKALDALCEQSGTSLSPNAIVLPKKDSVEKEVLGLFSPSHFEADLFAPYVPSDQLPSSDLNEEEQTFWAMLSALQNGFQPANLEQMNLKFALQLPNGNTMELKAGGGKIDVTPENINEFIAAVQAKKETIHLAFKYDGKMLDPILQFPKERAHAINPIQLSAQDLKAPIFSLVEGLAGNDFTPQDFEAMKLMYCIPFADTGKVYNLVPDGKNVLVTAKYRDDYIQRVIYERDRLQGSVSGGGASTSASGMGSSLQKEPPGMRKSITSVPMTDEQITALEEFRNKVKQLGETPLDEENWNDLGLAWVIRCGNITFDVIPDGSTKHVSFQQRNEFITKCLTKCDDIIADQAGRKNVVVPQAGADEMGLFSPTHFTQDLFAPAQHITTKTNLGTSVLHTTPVMPSAQSATSATPVQSLEEKPALSPSPPSRQKRNSISEPLSALLQKYKIANIETILAENFVTSIADLLELTDDDVRDMIIAVLPRRRLLDALATLR